jgi:putative transcriptional regulator
MKIKHHPSWSLVTAYAAGTLDQGQHIAVATHLAACPDCRALAREAENLGGEILKAQPRVELPSGAFDKVLRRLDAPPPAQTRPPVTENAIPELPDFVRRYHIKPWQSVAPALDLRRIELPQASPTRVFLLRSRAGTKLLRHRHTGFEMTCVLAGGFAHDGNHFEPGDFDLGDTTNEHEIAIAPERDCVCLVAMQGRLQLPGLLGRILQPFVRL